MLELTVHHEFNLESNMDEVKSSIAETISKYDIVVGEDQVAEAKQLMATFNKEKKAFSDKCKEFLEVISEPITSFKAKQKEIEKMYDDGRSKIADQVTKFEARKLEEIKTILIEYRNEACKEKNIEPESVIITDLILLSSVTEKMSLAKKARDTIDARIQSVENQILRAKIEAEEKAKRDREIAEQAKAEAEEKARQREAELVARMEREKQEALAQQARIMAVPVVEAQQAVEKLSQPIIEEQPKVEQALRDDGKKVFKIVAQFEILALAKIPNEMIVAKLTSMIEAGGITSLKSIEVV